MSSDSLGAAISIIIVAFVVLILGYVFTEVLLQINELAAVFFVIFIVALLISIFIGILRR